MKHFGKRLRWFLLAFVAFFVLGLLISNIKSDFIWGIYALILLIGFPVYLIYMIISEIKYQMKKKKHLTKKKVKPLFLSENKPIEMQKRQTNKYQGEAQQKKLPSELSNSEIKVDSKPATRAKVSQGKPLSKPNGSKIKMAPESTVQVNIGKKTESLSKSKLIKTQEQPTSNHQNKVQREKLLSEPITTNKEAEPSPEVKPTKAPDPLANNDKAKQEMVLSKSNNLKMKATIEPVTKVNAKRKAKRNIVIHHLRRKLYNFVVVDTETTGLSRSNDKVIQLSAIRYHHNKPVDTFDTYINPGNLPLPSKITAITGVQNDQLMDAPTFDDVKNKFLEFVGTLPWIGHNINSFDIPILINNGLDLTEISTIDTLKLAQKKLNMEHYTLENLKDYFNINHLSHNALEDCKTTAIVYQHLRDDNLTPIQADYSDIPQTLSGLNFAISGSFPGLSRNDVKKLIISHGGTVKSTVTHNTDYLVDGRQTSDVLTDGIHSSKELKARDYGTNILSISELRSLINNQ